LRWGRGDRGVAGTATGEAAASAKSAQDKQRQNNPILDAHSQHPRRQNEHSNDLTRLGQSRGAQPRRFQARFQASPANLGGREELPTPPFSL